MCGIGRRMVRVKTPTSGAASLALLLALLPSAAPAQVFDEFQVFDGRIAEQGGFDWNQHLVFGRRGRKEEDVNAPRNGVLATAEIGYATTNWHEVAVYVPVAREFSGDVYGGGFKLRNTFVLPNAGGRAVAGGFDVEIRHQSTRFSDTNWAVALRPIIDFRADGWQLILNPAVELPIGRSSPGFAPAVRGVKQVREGLWLGLEHYMEFGRFNNWERGPKQSHQLFATADVRLSERFSLNIGVGHGLTRNSDRWAGKAILSVDF